jgi:hypothetical protein
MEVGIGGVPQDVSTEHAADVLDAAEAGAEWGDGPVGDVEGGIDDGVVGLFGGLLYKSNKRRVKK